MNPLLLEKMKAGEIDVDTASRAAVAALAQDDARVLERLPAKTMAARIHAALDRAPAPDGKMGRNPFFLGLPAVALAAAVVLVVVVPDRGGDDDVILKGDAQPGLLIAKESKGEDKGVHTLAPGDVVKAGDVVQVRTKGAGFAHGVVVSVDGGGHVTRHFPDEGASTALPSGTTSLPFSFELDDAPRFERFFFVASAHALDVDAVVAAAQATTTAKDPRTAVLTGLPGDAVQTDFLLVKE